MSDKMFWKRINLSAVALCIKILRHASYELKILFIITKHPKYS